MSVSSEAPLTPGHRRRLAQLFPVWETRNGSRARELNSPAAVYIESAAGTAAGGKTGLTATVVGVLFLLILFLSPLAYLVPVYATAPALMYVGLLMLSNVTKLDFNDFVDEWVKQAATGPGYPPVKDGYFALQRLHGKGYLPKYAEHRVQGRGRRYRAAYAVGNGVINRGRFNPDGNITGLPRTLRASFGIKF